MAFSLANNNHSLSLNSHVSNVFHQQILYASNKLQRNLCAQLYSKVHSFLSSLQNYASLKYPKKILGLQNYDSFKKSGENDQNIAFRSLANWPRPILTPQCRFRNYWMNHLTASNVDNTVNIIRFNPKSHLISQVCSFKTEARKTTSGNETIGLCARIKSFFGFGRVFASPNINIKRDLESFQNAVIKENLSQEQSQRVFLAFVEGYLTAKESLMKQKSSGKLFRFSVAIVIAGIVYLLVKNSTLPSLFKSSGISIEISESNVKFNDVKGADEAKQELKNVVEFLKNPEKFSILGAKLPKGVLLVGPPGTGKTLLAKAVAGEAGVPFFSTSGPEFDEIYVGVGARRIRELFKLAKDNIPCVIFIDEIDSIGKERTSSSLHPHANDTINQLLSEMDGFRNSNGIIVLGATNRRDDLDKALLRPGRFDVEVSVAVPDYTGRKELIDFYLDQVRHQDIDTEKLARGTTNFTGADIENMINQAALRAAVLGAQYVTAEHLEHARDKALMGPESSSRIADEETNKITAYHEGGHTVVAYFTEHAQPLHKVTIIARGTSLGHTAYIPDKDIYHVTKTQLLAMLDSMMGGRAAEELVFGPEKVTSGASSDLEKATELASKMVRRWGMSETIGLTTYNDRSLLSPQTANLIDMEVKKILHDSYERAKAILIRHKDKHEELSEALLKHETLNAEDISAIMKGSGITHLNQKPAKTV